ncbi:MAG: Hpt domain-containing protein [Edaphobacter sp.]
MQNFDSFLLKPFSMDAFTTALPAHILKQLPTPAKQTRLFWTSPLTANSSLPCVPGNSKQLYTLCLTDVDSRLAKMQLAASNVDDKTFRAEAHAIKGSCGMVGAIELQTLANINGKAGFE